MRPFKALCKLLQRQTYSCLSTRSGIWFCLGGLILLGISALQFSEVLLEWSMQKYNIAFSADHDNIAGRSFQPRLCLPGPIDIVYTWVNGSDPQLIEELNKVKESLMLQLNLTSAGKHDEAEVKSERTSKKVKSSGKSRSNSEEKFKWKSEDVCPFPNCIPYNAIAVSGLQANTSEFALFVENKFLPGFQFSSFGSSIDPSVKVLVFGKDFNFENLRNHTITLKGKERRYTRVFVSSTLRMGAQKLDGIGMINYVPKDITVKMIENGLHNEKLNAASIIISNNVSVIELDSKFKTKYLNGPFRGRITINDQNFKVLPATFVWKPLTPLEIGRDIIEEDVSSSRFADNEELKYSLRSVEKYAPWVRNIYIVTNGQIPSWLNLDHPRMKIVTHEELFVNKSHLPTFSSPAIETHIHRIPGLSKRFIYMNDDVFFGDYVWPDDFYTHTKGQKIYLTWPVPNCNEGCPASWVNDKYCDKPCNVSECDWDGGDCLNTNGKTGFPGHAITNFHGNAYSAIGEYCNGGCANSWIGDRYCDANCNVPNCGYDAGDCGIQKFKELFSVNAEKIKGTLKVPDGVRAFYINFTGLLNDGVLTDGDYVESSVIRAAIFSKKFKTMSVTLYVNFTSTVSFAVVGFKDKNQTIPINLNFTISVDTTKEQLPTTTRNPATKLVTNSGNRLKSLREPFTVYNEASKRIEKSDPRMRYKNKTMNDVFDWFKATEREIPLEIISELNKTENELNVGDITENGYSHRKFKIIRPFYESSRKEPAELEGNKANLQRIKRHLLSMSRDEENPDERSVEVVSRNPFHKRQAFGRLKIIDKPMHRNEKTQKGVHSREDTSLSRWILKYGYWDPLKDVFSTSPHRWERQHYFNEIILARERLKRQIEYKTERMPGRVLLDTFASSLLHVSRLYNRAFGYKARKVPAHMPHFVDVDVVNEMQKRFGPYFEMTSSNKIRSENDMQFAFSYSYFVMDVPAILNMSLVFDELDTDATDALSERELRTLAARMFSLPLQASDVRSMEIMLLNCSKELKNSSEFSTLVVTRELVVNCKQIENTLKDAIKRKRYKFELIGDEDVTFKMIRNNVSQLIYQLDWIRKNRRKFVCLNDNIDHENPQSNLIRAILKDFLEYSFPVPSQFELPYGFRNKFLKVSELKKWKSKVTQDEEYKRMLLYFVVMMFLVFLLRRYIFKVFRFLVNVFNRKWNSNRGLNFSETELMKI